MLKALSLILLFISSTTIASQGITRQSIESLIPPELRDLTDKNSKQIQSRLKGKISSTTKNALFVNYHSKNDVTVGLKNDKFKYLLVNANDEMKKRSEDLFGQIYSDLTPQQKEKIAAQFNSAEHSAGRSISIDLPSLGVKLDFNNNEKKTLNSIIIWPVGGEHP